MRNFFGFSYTEIWGYTLIFTLLLICSGALNFLKLKEPRSFLPSNGELAMLDSVTKALKIGHPPSLQIDSPKRHPSGLFLPATVSYDSLITWGVPLKVARNLVNYRKAGGVFQYKEDLRKIYGMDDSLWNYLLPYIDLPLKPEYLPIVVNNQGRTRVKDTILDINLADSSELTVIRGIGQVLSSRIVRYRNILGGFYSKDQFDEVYGLSEEVLERLKQQVIINPDFKYHKISLNSFDFKQLSRHPYLSFEQAKAIVAYRNLHGPFEELDQLRLIHLIDDPTFNKLYPYLDF